MNVGLDGRRIQIATMNRTSSNDRRLGLGKGHQTHLPMCNRSDRSIHETYILFCKMVLQLRAHHPLVVQQRVSIQGRKTNVQQVAPSRFNGSLDSQRSSCHLKIPKESIVAAFEFLGKTRFRNRPLLNGDKTTKSYEIHQRQFVREICGSKG